MFVENNCELWLTAGSSPPLLLTGDTEDTTGTYTIEALGEDATWDNPVPVDVSVQRWMTDGAAASTQGYENREPYFKVLVSADSSADLAAAEDALFSRLGQVATLKWVPPQGQPDAPASVFEVWTGHLEHQFDDVTERDLERIYGIRLTAKPWVRSENITVVDALPTITSPTTTAIDTGDALSGTGFSWFGVPNAATQSSGGVREQKTVSQSGNYTVTLVRNGLVNMGTLPFLMVTSTMIGGRPLRMDVYADGRKLTQVATIGNTSYWKMPAGVTVFTNLTFNAYFYAPYMGNGSFSPSTTMKLAILDLSRTDTPAGIGTHKQSWRDINVGGSVKTAGSIQVSAAVGLGNVLIYTQARSQGGFVPAISSYRTGGPSPTADSGAVSGFRIPLTSAGASSGTTIWTITNNQLREGTYAVVGRFKSDTFPVRLNGNLTASVTGGTAAAYSGAIQLPVVLSGNFAFAPVATISLPTQQLPIESTLSTIITLNANGGAGVQHIDELYLLDLTRGAVSIIAAGGATRLWIDAPDVDTIRNRPAVYTGSLADRSDAVGVDGSQIQALMAHELDEDGASMLAVTDGAPDATITASFYRRWFAHAGS